MQYWLMKSEPDVFGIDDLRTNPDQTEPWDGVRNYQARNMMRDEMKSGDLALFYHSNCKPPGIAGIMKIVKTSYPDHTSWDPESKYFDPKSTIDAPRWFMVDVKFEEAFSALIPLNTLKTIPALHEMKILQKGNRLSITPVTAKEWATIIKLAHA